MDVVIRGDSPTNGQGQRKFRDWVGETVDRLKIEEYIPGSRSAGTRSTFRCSCTCGTTGVVVSPYNLLYGGTGSCGCKVSERMIRWNKERTKHGLATSPEYKIWVSMVARCHNSNSRAYDYYGGRGITVCPEWRESFEAFIRDMGRRPAPHLTVERQDNNAGYSKGNCVWATRLVQQNNTRSNVRIQGFGETRTVSQWASELGIARTRLASRLAKGLSLEEIVAEIQRIDTPADEFGE